MHIQLTDIHKSFGRVHANDGVTLSIGAGTIHGLLGENGAGKTTLMKILSGYQPFDAGRICIDGAETRFASPAQALAAGIGMLHQDPLDVPALSVLDNYALGTIKGLRANARMARRDLMALCQRFGFALDPDAPVSGLTVGERQQLEIARLLGMGVRTLILDEPTTGISAPQKTLLFETLQKLAAEGLSVVFVSHKLDEVEQLCSEVTVLRQGRVAGHARPPFDSDELVEMMFGQCLSKTSRPSMPLGEVVLELKDVSLRTPRLRMQGLNLWVRRGEVIGLAGLEGSGQQALMHACAGIQPIEAGKLMVAGEEMGYQPYRRFLERGVRYVPAARLEEGLIAGLDLRGHYALLDERPGFLVPWREATEQTNAMIQEFNIVGRPETLVQELSGGNQQRALLSMLPEDTRVLMLEHPTRGLDIESADWVWQKLLRRCEQGAAILFTSTDLDELVEYSDRIVVFSGGVMSAPLSASDVTCEQLGYLIGGRGI